MHTRVKRFGAAAPASRSGGPLGPEYEDAYAIDHGLGDMIFEETIRLVADVTR